MASNHGAVSHLLPQTYKRLVSSWLEEDCPGFDYAGFVVGEKMAEARLMGKSAVRLIEYCSCLDLSCRLIEIVQLSIWRESKPMNAHGWIRVYAESGFPISCPCFLDLGG